MPPLPEDVQDDLFRILFGPAGEVAAGLDGLRRQHPDLVTAIDAQCALTRQQERDGTNTPAPAAPHHIGPYRLLQRIGHGGFGEVWSAEQRTPVRRQVAIKLIKLGMDSEEVVRRFAQERQALSLMDHPNVAHIYDGGIGEQGRPYFVMEYVKGVPITRYCDESKLDLRQRIELFQKVCAGVQHAHQKGLMHRDLKPSNILVALQDGKPMPKIIDFGLAKALDHRLTDATLFTERGKVLGTPEYMSPEQAGLGGIDVDTRTDVYSLGVVLYELLTGELPFSRKDLQKAGATELQQLICEVDPQKPSTRVTPVSSTSADAARRRGLDPQELRRRLRGDLDWIVLKALEKDRSRRYETALELSADLDRHLQHMPVLASPPSTWYRTRKFVRRYRAQCAAAALVLAALTAGGIGTWVQFVRAEQNAVRAKESEVLATQRAADLARTVQAEQAARTEAVQRGKEAQTNLDRFKLLATVLELAEAKQAEQKLWPVEPKMAPAMEKWLREVAEPLVQKLPGLERTLEELNASALPMAEAEKDAALASHPLAEDLQRVLAEQQSFDRANAVRDGKAQVVEPELDAETREQLAVELNSRAWGEVDPSNRRFGNEAKALAMARLAAAKSAAGDTSFSAAEALDTLAWACLANGLDQEAIRHSDAALGRADDRQRDTFLGYRDQLRAEVARHSDTSQRRERAAQLGQRTSNWQRLIERTLPRRFADDGTRFLHQTLAGLVLDLHAFQSERGGTASVRSRHQQASTIEQRSLVEPASKWNDAIAAIARSDGITASASYGGLHITPQLGLVPIGMDPESKLWEFVHLLSGSPGKEAPKRDPSTGRLVPDGDMGIVLVLLPGGEFTMGAQREDPNGPNYSPVAHDIDKPMPVSLDPFFLGKHEVTRAQWSRLMNNRATFWFPEGLSMDHDQPPIGPTHPAESMTWAEAREGLQRSGLQLPTEAQWEYGARGGTITDWWTGMAATTLAGAANVLDETGGRFQLDGVTPAPFNDGFSCVSPVGTFRPNPFGLHDVHGNVNEWCMDGLGTSYAENWTRPQRGDGLRHTPSDASSRRVKRGGAWNFSADNACSFRRDGLPPATRLPSLGIRPTRALLLAR